MPTIAVPDLGAAEVATLAAQIDRVLDNRPTSIVLTAPGVAPNNSLAIAVLATVLQRVDAQNIALRWQDTPDAVREAAQALAHREPEVQEEAHSWTEGIGHRVYETVQAVRLGLAFIGEVVAGFAQAAREPGRVRWRDTFFYMDRCGVQAVPIVLMICFLTGLILGFQSVVQLQAFGAELYVADLVGLSITKELGPLMVAMICTGRAGSAFAAEIGTMAVSEEIDALETMDLDPIRFLVIPKMLALVLVMPLLTILGSVAGLIGGAIVGIAYVHIPVAAYMSQTVMAIDAGNVCEGLIKSVVFGVLISGVGCLRGMQTDGGATGVGQATTRAVVSAIFLVVIADALVTYLATLFAPT